MKFAQLTLEFPVPLEILIIPITPYTFPVTPSHLLYISPVPLSAPVIPCAYPPSSLTVVHHHLCTYCHLKFSPVTPCTCLYHPGLPPSSPIWSLPAQWSVWCLLYTRSFAVTNHETSIIHKECIGKALLDWSPSI